MHTAETRSQGKCASVIVTTAEGVIYDLGPPTHPLFRLRLWLYRKKRGI